MRALTRASIMSPAAIAVGVAVVILFGVFALDALPIQLFPDIDRPQVGIATNWRAETPRELEAQIIQPEEDVLQGLPGLQEMDGFANNGSAQIGFWFFQADVGLVGSGSGTFSGTHQVGDLLILTNFTTGGAVSNVGVLEWVLPERAPPYATHEADVLRLGSLDPRAQARPPSMSGAPTATNLSAR